MDFILAIVIIMCAAMIQGISGFGFSLLAVPLLAFVMPLEVIVPVLVLFSLVLNIVVFTKVKGHINKLQIFILVTFGLISVPIGIYTLKFVDPQYIKLVVGVVVVVSAIAMNFNYKIRFKNQNIAYGLAGFFSGILNGSSSLSGPPVILLLSNEGVEKSSFRKTLATYFMVLNLFSIPMFIKGGLVTKHVLLETLKLSPAMIVGVLLGVLIGDKLPDHIFKKITLTLIFVMGILTVVSAL